MEPQPQPEPLAAGEIVAYRSNTAGSTLICARVTRVHDAANVTLRLLVVLHGEVGISVFPIESSHGPLPGQWRRIHELRQ
jgi:hypothetical protein